MRGKKKLEFRKETIFNNLTPQKEITKLHIKMGWRRVWWHRGNHTRNYSHNVMSAKWEGTGKWQVNEIKKSPRMGETLKNTNTNINININICPSPLQSGSYLPTTQPPKLFLSLHKSTSSAHSLLVSLVLSFTCEFDSAFLLTLSTHYFNVVVLY